MGRFTQEDVYRGDGLNLYAYVGNNPIKYIDPSGYVCEQKYNLYKEFREQGMTPKQAQEQATLAMETLRRPQLPPFDGKTTHGVLVTPDGNQVPFSSGNADPKYSNYIPASHVEGKAALHMRENGITQGTVYHNNTDGTCPYCDKMLPTLLEKNSVLEVIPPVGSTAPKPSWVDVPKTYTGNDKIPKTNSKYNGGN